MRQKYICVHGHFYQPPRENAWLETIEYQESAAPFHDWNTRINTECYSTNAAARILDHQGWIIKIRNNYNRISFNFGPTLLSWLEKEDKETYQLIIQADKRSRELFGGHGNAIAQVHSHLILPLCNQRDKITQVQWGIRDFEYRFERKPEGMWLSESAVDTASLEVLAAHGITFTVLAPRQAKAIKKIGTDTPWMPVQAETIDTTRPYWCHLPSGRKIALFFYNGDIAQGVAFERLLDNGKRFAARLCSGFRDDGTPQLVSIATDGESYGHHHRHGEMALADALNQIEENSPAKLTNFGQFLEMFPPEWEVQIHDNSSWSCVHGVERWRSDCGCNSGVRLHQRWREPLRNTLDWLRDALVEPYEKEMSHFAHDSWLVRNHYIDVLLNRNEETVADFIQQHCKRKLSSTEEVHFLRLLEMQRHAMLMYTSCGWFFDEISGLETNQILQYALRAMDYAEDIFGIKLHSEFEQRLSEAPSNMYPNGAVSFQRNVIPSRVALKNVAMHFAVASLFEEHPFDQKMFNYTVTPEQFQRQNAGQSTLSLGKLRIKSAVTHFERSFYFAALYMGQHHLIGNISMDMSSKGFDALKDQLIAAFQRSELGEMIGIMQQHFGSERFSISSLFHDQKREIITRLTRQNLEKARLALEETYDNNYAIMLALQQNKLPLPEQWKSIAKQVIRQRLLQFIKDGTDLNLLKSLEQDVRIWGISIPLEYEMQLAVDERICAMLMDLQQNTVSLESLHVAVALLQTLENLGINADLGRAQNYFFMSMKAYRKGLKDFDSAEQKVVLESLSKLLRVHIRTASTPKPQTTS